MKCVIHCDARSVHPGSASCVTDLLRKELWRETQICISATFKPQLRRCLCTLCMRILCIPQDVIAEYQCSMEFETRMVFDTINEMEGVRVAAALGINVGNNEVRHSLRCEIRLCRKCLLCYGGRKERIERRGAPSYGRRLDLHFLDLQTVRGRCLCTLWTRILCMPQVHYMNECQDAVGRHYSIVFYNQVLLSDDFPAGFVVESTPK